MARIEINLDEYIALKERITELEKNISEQDKIIEEKSSYINELEETMEFVLHGTTWLDRIFNWKTIIDIAESDEDTK